MREISLLKQLTDYPNFVRLLDVLEQIDYKTNKIHCVFEYCESTLFQKLAKRKQPLEWPAIKSIMIQMLDAVNILHGKMILHRDIKPENVLITRDGVLKKNFSSWQTLDWRRKQVSCSDERATVSCLFGTERQKSSLVQKTTCWVWTCGRSAVCLANLCKQDLCFIASQTKKYLTKPSN
jgi:serine/threonine protein kinase